MHGASAGQGLKGRAGGMLNVPVAHLGGGRGIARADAGRPQDAHAWHVLVQEGAQQLFRPGQHAAQAVAHTHGDFGRFGFTIGHDVEVGIKRRHLVDLGHRDAELFGQCMQETRRQAPLFVLDQVQIFDQECPLAGRFAKQGAQRVELGLLEHTALGKGGAFAPAGPGMDRPAHALTAAARDLRYVVHAHQRRSPRVSRWHTIYQRPGRCRGAPACTLGGRPAAGDPSDV